MSTCALPVRNLRRALCEQNTPRRSRRVSHTCPRKEPIRSEFTTQPGLCLSAGSATSTACVPGPGLTLAAEHVGVSCVARHGPSACCRADPGQSQLQLPPLPGFCLSTVAVVVSMRPTHTCVSRRPDCTPPNSHSHRETRLHARAWRPPSPLCTATSHTLSFSQHTVAHSLVPHSHTPHHSHTRGHSPAVFRTRVPSPAAVPLYHTACREARTPARS